MERIQADIYFTVEQSADNYLNSIPEVTTPTVMEMEDQAEVTRACLKYGNHGHLSAKCRKDNKKSGEGGGTFSMDSIESRPSSSVSSFLCLRELAYCFVLFHVVLYARECSAVQYLNAVCLSAVWLSAVCYFM